MKFSVREIVSLVLGLGGIAILGIGMTNVLDTGTCASGGAHAIARQCPPGSAAWGFLLPVGFFVWFAGLFVSKEGLVKPGAGRIIWTVGFAGGGVALLVNALTQPSLGPGSALGSYIMAAVFIPAGVGVWIPAVIRLGWRGSSPEPQPRVAPTPRPTVRDRTAFLLQLNRLRSGGALTRAEFDQLKAEDGSGQLDLIQQLADLKASGILTADEFEAKKQTVMHGDSGRAAG